jgi:broad specificity phosphatase PhoE
LDELWLVRHGETEWTVSRKHTGRTDIELTAAGEQRARELEPLLVQHSFAAAFTSPLQRARQTAALAGFEDAEVLAELHEVDYGEYEGRTTAEIRAERPDWLLWRDGSPGGETVDEVGARADGVLERLEAVDGNVIVFGHGHFSRVLAARALGLPPSEGRLLMLGPASISVIGDEHGDRAIKHWAWQAQI